MPSGAMARIEPPPGHPVTRSCYMLPRNKALFTGQALAAPRYSVRDKAADTMDNIRESET